MTYFQTSTAVCGRGAPTLLGSVYHLSNLTNLDDTTLRCTPLAQDRHVVCCAYGLSKHCVCLQKKTYYQPIILQAFLKPPIVECLILGT